MPETRDPVPVLRAQLASEAAEVRRQAARHLAGLGGSAGPAVPDLLRHFARSPDPVFRREAWQALERIPWPSDLDTAGFAIEAAFAHDEPGRQLRLLSRARALLDGPEDADPDLALRNFLKGVARIGLLHLQPVPETRSTVEETIALTGQARRQAAAEGRAPLETSAAYWEARAWEVMGALHWLRDKAAAREAYARFHEGLERLADLPDAPDGLRAEAAMAELKLTDTRWHLGETEAAEATYAALRDRILAMDPLPDPWRHVAFGLIAAYTVLGERALLADDPARAASCFDAVSALARKMPGRAFGPFHADVVDFQARLAALHALALNGYPGEARDLLEPTARHSVLAQIRPDERPAWDAYLAGVRTGLGRLHAASEAAEREAAWRGLAVATEGFGNRAVPAAYLRHMLQILPAPDADDAGMLRRRADLLARLAVVAETIGPPEAVAARHAEAVAAWRRVRAAAPDDPDAQREATLAEARQVLALSEADAAPDHPITDVRARLDDLRRRNLLSPDGLAVLRQVERREAGGAAGAYVEAGVGLGPFTRPWFGGGVRYRNWYFGVTQAP